MSATGNYALVPGVRKIAVVRANAIGDLMFVLPALEAVRAAYPAAEIVLLGQEWHVDFMRGRPGPVDRTVAIPPLKGVSLSDDQDAGEHAGEVARFLEEMRNERFDLALQMHGGGRYSNTFTLALGARLTAGLKTPEADPLDRWVPYQYWQREVLRYLEVVSLIGARPVTVEPRLSLRPEDLEESFWVVPGSGQRMVVIHPGVGDPMRRWPPEKFAAVGDALAELGAEILVTAGREDEREIVDAVVSQMKCPARAIWRKLSLGGLAGLISRCDLMVGNDSGPLQMAAALGTPTVGIFWCGNLITAQPVTQAKHRQLISWTLDCPQCGRNTISDPCEHNVPYVSDVPTEDVIAAALDVFGDGGLRRMQPPSFSQTEQPWAS